MSATQQEPFPLVMGAYDTIATKCTQLQRDNAEHARANSDFLKKVLELEEQIRRLKKQIRELQGNRTFNDNS